MSPKLKRLSGGDVVSILLELGFKTASQRGSHVKLVRTGANDERQILTVPLHKELDTGTLQAIIRQASKYINPQILQKHFYTQ